MFGRIMEIRHDGGKLELKPIAKDDMKSFLPHIQKHSVLRYWGADFADAPTIETEEEYYEAWRKDKGSFVCGIFFDDRMIGFATLFDIVEANGLKVGSSSLMIFDKDFWGKGIAGAVHKARLMYAFEQLNMSVIKSGINIENHASKKAVKSVGYVETATNRNTSFVDGKFAHTILYQCVNPFEYEWNCWWHGDEIPAENFAARERTLAAIEWAHENVELI